jgi:DNA ligase-1
MDIEDEFLTLSETTSFPTLYSIDAKRNVLSWVIKVFDNNQLRYAVIEVEEGLYTGEKTKRATTVKVGKNIGKNNETTYLQQAVKDAQSKWNKKKLVGYKETIEQAMEEIKTLGSGSVAPMKAVPYYNTTNGKIQATFPCYGNYKYNGLRANIMLENDKVVIKSKNGIYYNAPQHIHNFLSQIFKECPDAVFDGELYIHNTKLNEILSAATVMGEKTLSLCYVLYDFAVSDNDMVNRLLSIKLLRTRFNISRDDYSFPVTTASYFDINNEADCDKFLQIAIERGYEGIILRDKKAHYQFGKRNKALVKRKEITTEEFIIIDVVDTNENPGIGIFVCRNNINNETFKVNSQGVESERRNYLENKQDYINKLLSLGFYERTAAPKELPFHIKEVVVRNYE